MNSTVIPDKYKRHDPMHFQEVRLRNLWEIDSVSRSRRVSKPVDDKGR